MAGPIVLCWPADTPMTTDTALLSLLRLVSPALPVGGFAYSQGLEYAVDAGWVKSADQVRDWLAGVLVHGLGRLDVPLVLRLHEAVGDDELFGHWNDVALAARRWGVAAGACCQGYLWSWLENQLTVAAKTVPIGQTDCQRIAAALMPAILNAVETGSALGDGDIGGGLPGMAMASMLHETQYSRLFRS